MSPRRRTPAPASAADAPRGGRAARGAAKGATADGRKAGKKAGRKEGGFFWRWRRVWFACALLFVLGVSGLAYLFTQVPLPDKDPPLLQTSLFCASDVSTDCNLDNSIAQLSGGVDRVSVTYDQLPQVLIDAVLAAEDRDFYTHGGVDPAGIVRAFVSNLRSQDVQQGGSTITQQYVKNVYLSQERTVTRKLKEAALAVKLERELPKQEILLRYLNTIYFGRGAYGVEAASRAYFAKPVEQLTLTEAAYLAGLIRSPETADANKGTSDPSSAQSLQTATRRRNSVLDAMLKTGAVTPAQHDAAVASGFETVVARRVQTNFGKVANPEWGTEYFIDDVRRWLVTDGGFTDAEVFGGGLRVYTTLDLQDQKAAYEAVTSTLDRPDDPAGALVSVDGDGAVRAMVGGTDYANNKVNLATGSAGGGGGRQPGSSFKPFVLAEAVAQGIPLTRTYNAPAKITIPKADNGKDWSPGNYADAGLGTLNLVEATAESSNTAYAQLMVDVGPDNAVAMAKRLGITSPMQPYVSSVLGTQEVSVREMASAYSTFADDGVHNPSYTVTKVTDARGKVLYQHSPNPDRVLDKDQAQQVNWALNAVVRNGTGKSAALSTPTAGKTGTTDNYKDAWFVGFSCRTTAAVWLGYPGTENRYMEDVHGIKVTGGSLPAQIWRKYMSQATRGATDCPGFEQPTMAPEIRTDDTSVATTVPRSSTTSSTSTTAPPSSTTTARPSTTTAPAPTTTRPPPTTAPTSSTTTAPVGPAASGTG